METARITELEVLKSLKAEYLALATAPLDGMWLCGFVPMASHFGFTEGSRLLGYCCVNEEGYLLQFYLRDNALPEGQSLLMDLIDGKYQAVPKIEGAYVSTAEPAFLSHCFDCFSSFQVNALMYHPLDEGPQNELAGDTRWNLEPIQTAGLAEAVEFGLRNVEAPREWLTGYFSNLIRRQELLGCRLDNQLIGTGESRKFENVQEGYTDLGVIVDQEQRGKGLATWILRELSQQAFKKGLKPLCSTERDNIGAQKAITRAGFVSRNRIIQFLV